MKKYINTDKLYPIAGIALALVLWQIIVQVRNVPGYILPSPTRIASALVRDFELIRYHSARTLYASFVGFGFSIVLAFILAIIMDSFEIIKKALYPLLVISQTVPIIAIAPLLIIWFGFGTLPKIIIVVIVCFFPIVISLVHGMESIDEDYLRLFKTMKATKLQVFYHLKLPFALVHFFSGLKIAATYMIMSAVIGEWLGGDRGIGVYMLRAKNAYALDRVFASILIIVIMSILIIYAIEILGNRVLHWQTERDED
ncbi:ABC transporter permease [Alkalibacter saccharofermentans]|uniref:ABC-type nitrate/sulfonate/bicarbonate transport system, permease component n=1 Tax=Alkalibacter saccharofermentans DSM 14828 TaxID=1120975 RepID=A0A1M4SIL4_9FIRM|nr:ABC transporter permease [Alkalibacter saccharofermentans]SHE32073.1 ABC-type nitrate/sulfonate/bicarbonate transport system, permease component [Alkalibacter saccharofermentans DSM 14828]